MKELILTMARALVDLPEQISVEEVRGDHTTVFELRVAKSDLGKIIGKHGRNAEAIRTIVAAVSAKLRKRTIVEIIDIAEQARGRKPAEGVDVNEKGVVYAMKR